jgi:hypothetical protein
MQGARLSLSAPAIERGHTTFGDPANWKEGFEEEGVVVVRAESERLVCCQRGMRLVRQKRTNRRSCYAGAGGMSNPGGRQKVRIVVLSRSSKSWGSTGSRN